MSIKGLLFSFLLFLTGLLSAQHQIDFREQSNLRAEHRFTQDFALALMGAVILTNDFKEPGFAYADAGLGFKINSKLGINANYRLLMRRNLRNGYDKRHVLYADLDYATPLIARLSFASTIRLQGQFYNHLFTEGPRAPVCYLRTRAGLRYKINYYWQPFVESELFTPLFLAPKPLPDQIRASIGIAYTFNRKLRVELYEQVQREINSSTNNIFLLTAINWGIRF